MINNIENSFLDRSRVYGEMVADLYRDLLSGKLSVGDKLPTEADLRKRYNISISSVRKGIEEFVSKGILTRRRGSGMYVSRLPEAMAQVVKKDTIALFYSFELNVYHPFYTEFFQAQEEGLAKRGWKVRHVHYNLHKTPSPKYETDFYSQDLVYGTLQDFMHAPEIAGAILSSYFPDDFLSGCRRLFPIVVSGKHADHPYVANDIEEQLLQAFRLVISRGANSILQVGLKGGLANKIVRKAAFLEDRGREKIKHEFCQMTGGNRVYSQFTHEAYEKTLAFLQGDTAIDAVVAENEFVLQGVLDAVSVVQRESARNFSISAIVNEKSNIHSSVSFHKVIIDPRLYAEKLVELLEKHIYAPENAPKSIDICSYMVKCK